MTEANLFPLSDAEVGSRFLIKKIDIDGMMRRRLLDLGFVPGGEIIVLQKSPLGDPVAYRVSQTTIALRKEESSKIWGTILYGF
ncbi:ferrous iron transport protein A [Bacillus aquiflavi]|uniref:Ferrous iron transport protein A n=1 Tax=Bacillus aquiflavi TaxID=2672567 RepID=A0A6B3W225_9BACI|nr:FeoA family protein [Bacillus aquiflavi]MBA4537327.1 ferrous iron transport protein A [Bacillus aquiflavi]NEY81584.1 ferrous iron transport protein A [Bacillus aquiflavi]UAC47111.1 ferrous iron transport protein A [Bacillus aquiflavi]